MNYRAVESILGRWYLVLSEDPSLAWSGSRWVFHSDGLGLEVQVSNFDTKEDAEAYAAERFSQQTKR